MTKGIGQSDILWMISYLGGFIKKEHKKGYLSQTANLFVNLKSNTMKNTLQIYGVLRYLQINQVKRGDL
ncbi:hypothetical protein OXV62_15440 [Bacteroides faecis]|nr:hypothetical protein [Bacteroides faecis]